MRLRVRIATTLAVVAAVAVLAALAAAGTAGPPGRWTQITHAHNGAKANLGLGRAKDGTLHVVWAGPNRGPYKAILDTPISPAGAVGQQRSIVSGWNSVQPPAAAVAPDGSIHALVSGQKVLSNTDPYAGLNEVVGPGSWKLGARAFGTYQITVPSNAEVGVAVLPNGQLVSVWRTAVSLLFQVGTDPSTQPQNITPPGLAESPVIAVDSSSGEAIVAYRNASNGTDSFRRVAPSPGAPQTMPGAKTGAPSIAARTRGGGVYSAYALDGTKVRLVRYGGQTKAVPVPKGARVLTAGVAAGPEGRLWVFYGNEQTTYVTRTSKAAGGFEPVQTLKSPAGTVQYFRLEGEGSAGPLDLFANVTIDGSTRDGSYHQQVQPALSVSASKQLIRKQGKVTGARVTVRVTDAGDPIQGARVTGLPGGPKTTDARGSIVVTVPSGNALALSASKPGYVGAKTRLSL